MLWHLNKKESIVTVEGNSVTHRLIELTKSGHLFWEKNRPHYHYYTQYKGVSFELRYDIQLVLVVDSSLEIDAEWDLLFELQGEIDIQLNGHIGSVASKYDEKRHLKDVLDKLAT